MPPTAARYVGQRRIPVELGHFHDARFGVARAAGALRPDMLAACRAAFAARSADRDFLRVGADAFAACPADSIDYAVMEKLPAGLGVVIPLAAGWSDVGAWDALWQIGDKDGDGNVLRGDVMAVDTRDTLAISQSRLVACVGLADTVVVETPDAVLVAHKSRIQQVKEVVARLKRERPHGGRRPPQDPSALGLLRQHRCRQRVSR